MSAPCFDVYKIADISTRHINRRDGELIGQSDAPGHVASTDPKLPLDDPSGDVFAVFLDGRHHKKQMSDLQTFGFSGAFIRIFQALYRQRIPYVRFDIEGGEVEGLPEFDW